MLTSATAEDSSWPLLVKNEESKSTIWKYFVEEVDDRGEKKKKKLQSGANDAK